MEKVILEEIKRFSEKETGLSIIEVPTGRGKTHNVLVWISQYMKKCRKIGIKPRKIFFLTTQLKNLPYDDLAQIYYDKEQFYKDVLKIEKNLSVYLKDDGSFEKIQKKIPREIKGWSEYESLESCLYKYKRILDAQKKNKIDYSSDLNKAEEELCDIEKTFRHHLEQFILEKANELEIEIPEGEDKDKYLKRTIVNMKFNWIKELYPAINTENRNVFLLSITKFLYGNTTIIEKTYKFLNNPITEGAIVFIDEFDATKTIIEDIMLENAANCVNDKILLFKNIKSGFDNELPTLIEQTKGKEQTFQKMKNMAQELYSSFYLSKRFQLAKDFRDESRNFMFHDEILHTLREGHRTNILAVNNSDTKKMDIKFLTKTEEELLGDVEYISISSLLENLEEYFRMFRSFIKRWAKKYSVKAGITEEQAVYTILDVFDIHDNAVNMLMENGLYYTNYRNMEKQQRPWLILFLIQLIIIMDLIYIIMKIQKIIMRIQR